MVYLKEDGSLDVERINKLPIEEKMIVIGNLSQEQYKEFYSKLPINECNAPFHTVKVDYTLEEDIKKGTVNADDFLNKMRKKYGL